MVFQGCALYPHLDMRGNMALGLKQEGQPRDVIDARIAEAAWMLELGPYLGPRDPSKLRRADRQWHPGRRTS